MFDTPLHALEPADRKAYLDQEVPKAPFLIHAQSLANDLPVMVYTFANTVSGKVSADCGTEARRFDPRRSSSQIPHG